MQNRRHGNAKRLLLPIQKINSIESFLLGTERAGNFLDTTFSTKTFSKPFAAGKLNLGYTNLSALTLTGYTTPSNYSVNLVTGVVTSVDIADGTVVPISLTLAAKNLSFRLTAGRLTPEAQLMHDSQVRPDAGCMYDANAS